MKIGVFGTGVVAQTIAEKLSTLGHAVMIGTRDPAATLARAEPGAYGNPSFKDWRAQHPPPPFEKRAEDGRARPDGSGIRRRRHTSAAGPRAKSASAATTSSRRPGQPAAPSTNCSCNSDRGAARDPDRPARS